MPLPYEPTTNFRNSNGTDLGKILVTQDYVATVYPSLTQSAAGFVASPAELYGWGLNTSGELGNFSTVTRSTPTQEFSSSANWKQVTIGNSQSMAIKTDGTLWCWGAGPTGELGINIAGTNRSTPTQVSIADAGGLTGWKQVYAGTTHTAAVREDGTLWCWGNNSSGGIGDNTIIARSTPRQISAGATRITGWKQVAAGSNSTAAIRYDGTLWLWGLGNSGQLGDNSIISKSAPIQEFTASNNWKQVSYSGNTVLAIKNDGTLWSWGSNNNGQVGDNTNLTRSTPRQISSGAGIGINGWKQISTGNASSAALRNDGTLWLWGLNSYGQLGNNNTVHASTPVQEATSSTNWKQVSSGGGSVSAIKTDGTLWTWGRNDNGQIGDNTTQPRSTPRQEFTSSTNWRQTYTTGFKTFGIKFPMNQPYTD